VSDSFDPSRGLIIVSAHVWGPSGFLLLSFALDTGALSSVVKWESLAGLGYDPAGSPLQTTITSASGTLRVPRVIVDRVDALGATRVAFPMLAHTLPSSIRVDGLLGLDFLRGQRLTVDFRQGLVTLD
jgi:predicted aspartyl protease